MLRNHPPATVHPSKTTDTPCIALAEYAGLALDVYNDKAHANPPAGWDRFYEYETFEEGYFAACYVKVMSEDNIAIVIAHRGTANAENMIPDLKLFFGDAHLTIFKHAYHFTIEAIALVCQSPQYSHYSNQYIASTGHSLGSVLSDAVSVAIDPQTIYLQTIDPQRLRTGMNLTSTTFESPGTKDYLLGMLAIVLGPLDIDQRVYYMSLGDQRCATYLANTDMINTNSAQLGTVYRLIDLPFHYLSGMPDSLSTAWRIDEFSYAHYIDNNYYMTTYLLDQHAILYIYDYLSSGGAVEITSNPVGFQAGYVCYLDPHRTVYWQGYTETCWQQYPHLQKQYKDLAAYQAAFMQTLGKTYIEAQKLAGISPTQAPQAATPTTDTAYVSH